MDENRIDKDEISRFIVDWEDKEKTDKEFIDFFINLVDNKSLCYKVNLGQTMVNAGLGFEDTRNPDTE